MWKTALEFCLDFLFPRRCVSCSREGAMICPPCRDAVPTVAAICFVCERRSPEGEVCKPCKGRTRLRRFISPLSYRERTVQELIHALKYTSIRDISEILAGYIAEYINEVRLPLPETAILIPIPLHKKRLRERGFNQAEEIVRHLAHALSLPTRTDLLIRTKYASPQTTMKSREAREANAKGMYEVRGSMEPGMTCILIDDVSTTGATLEEAARVLKEAGAKQVWAFTAARS